MKQTLFLIITLIAISTASHANHRFGITGVSDGGAGIIFSSDAYSASLLFSTINKIDGADSNKTNIELNAKYKFILDSLTRTTIGLRHVLIEYKEVDDDDSDENTKTALTAGIEQNISDRVLIFAETDVYAIQDIDDGDTEVSIFNSARVGVSILF